MRHATFRFISSGAGNHGSARTALSGRSRLQRIAIIAAALLIGIPILLVFLGVGAVVLAVGLLAGLGLTLLARFRTSKGAGSGIGDPGSGRENVRVVRRGQ